MIGVHDKDGKTKMRHWFFFRQTTAYRKQPTDHTCKDMSRHSGAYTCEIFGATSTFNRKQKKNYSLQQCFACFIKVVWSKNSDF